ncbi:MFS transporter [Streptomyces erythrogriseus]
MDSSGCPRLTGVAHQPRHHGAAPGGPASQRGIDPSGLQLLWIVDIYSFLIAGLLIIAGTLGDRFGRRRLLVAGAAGFGLASVLTAFSTSAEMLIVSRALLGIAGATLMPSSMSLIRNMFLDARQRSVAFSVWIACFLVGGALGPSSAERCWNTSGGDRSSC